MFNIVRQFFRRTYSVGLVLFTCFLLGVGAGLFSGSVPRSPFERIFYQVTQGEKQDAFLSVYASIGPIEARLGLQGTIDFIEYILKGQKISTSQCHTLLHALGHTAYGRYKGNWSVLVSSNSLLCVSSFEHGIEAQIAIDYLRDTDSLKQELRSFCEKIKQKHGNIPCYHGAGHAFLQAYKADLTRALSACDAMQGPPVSDVRDCYRGVFSEYGSEALGINGDTGLPIAGGPSVSLDTADPFVVCMHIPAVYERDCVSQIAKVLYTGNESEALLRCGMERYPARVRERCIMTIAGIAATEQLSREQTLDIPTPVLGFTDADRHAYIAGTAEGFIGMRLSNIAKDWKSWCQSFPRDSDRTLCREYLEFGKPLPI